MGGGVLDQFRLDGKVAIITGGAGFLGVQHAQAVMAGGGIPVIVDIDRERTFRTAGDLEGEFHGDALGLGGDVTDKRSMEKVLMQVLDRYDRVDILINNAAHDPKVSSEPGGIPWTRFEAFPEDAWERDLAVGLKGAFICSQVIGAEMERRNRGVILNISSDLGIIAPDQRIYRREGLPDREQPVKPISYSVVKHGLIGLTRYLATYWADRGIRVNALCPGGMYRDQSPEFVERLSGLIPMGRMASLGEYRAVVLFLISNASSYMTGSTVIVDGGRTCW